MDNAADVIQLSPDQLADIRRRAESDLFYFAKGILNYNYLDEEFHGPIAKFLQSGVQRKLVALPRGHFKTTLGTISYAIWRAVKDPAIRVLISNATATNAEKFLEAIKTQFESNGLLRAIWPEVIPDITKVRWNNTAVELRRDKPWTEATYEAIGVGGHVASRHYDLIIKDDLIDLSDKQDLDDVAQLIQTAVAWHQYSYGLFVNVENGEEVVIGTRWHRDDLLAWINKNQSVTKLGETSSMAFHYYEHAIRGTEPIFKRSADGKHGFTREGLDHLRRTLGPYKYSGQYQLNPSDPSVAEFQRTWLRYYSLTDDGRILLPGVVNARGGDVSYGVGQLDRYILVDPALSKKRKADYTGLVTVGVTPGAYKVVLEALDLKAEPLELIEAIIAAVERWRPICVGIEAVAFQKMIKPFLEFVSRSRGKHVPVREFKTDTRTSKENRIRALVPEFARGLIFIGASMGELESEYDGFPVASDQHLLDALAYGPQLWQSGEPMSDEEIAEAAWEEEVALAGRNELTGY
jgi:hypothetical protein